MTSIGGPCIDCGRYVEGLGAQCRVCERKHTAAVLVWGLLFTFGAALTLRFWGS